METFQVFAVFFVFISVAVGIFGTFDDVLRTAWPVGIWLWAVVAVGQTFVALVVAQFAARIPLTGSSYQWASRPANFGIGHWGQDGGFGYTYDDKDLGYELSAVAGMTYNFENPATRYRNGIDAHLDFSASKFIGDHYQLGLAG